MEGATELIAVLFTIILFLMGIGFSMSSALDDAEVKNERLQWQLLELKKERRELYANTKNNSDDPHRTERPNAT